MDGIRALVFDVFGTLVDWRGSIAREARVLLAPLGIALAGLLPVALLARTQLRASGTPHE